MYVASRDSIKKNNKLSKVDCGINIIFSKNNIFLEKRILRKNQPFNYLYFKIKNLINIQKSHIKVFLIIENQPIPIPKNEFAINKKLNKVEKINPNQHIVLRNNPYLYLIGTNLLFIVSIAIHANKGAVRKLPVIAANTKSFTPTPPDLAISKANKEAKICTIIHF